MPKAIPQTPQPSLEAPPVYRRFLSGDPRSLWLSSYEVLMIVGLGILTTLVSAFLADYQSVWLLVSSGLAATIAALGSAAIATRWLGRRIGLFAGYLFLISGQFLQATASPGDRWLAAPATIAVAAFAFANVAGRMPLVSGPKPVGVFYVSAAAILFFNGPATAAAVVLLCVVFLVAVQYQKGLRFFVDPAGIAVLAVAALAAWLTPGLGWNGGWNAAWPGGSVFSSEAWSQLGQRLVHLLTNRIPFDVLPWGPLALLGIVLGIRHGHTSTHFGRFLTVWLLAPLGMTFVGLISPQTAAVLIFPPLSIIGGIGMSELLIKISRIRKRPRNPIPPLEVCLRHKTSK